MKLYVLLFVSLSMMACSSKKKWDDGFNRGALVDQISEKEFVPTEIDDDEIKKALSKKATLPKNFRLAVYFKPSENGDWRWSGEDKHRVLNSLGKLQSTGIKANVFPLLESLTEGTDMKSLRLAAARHGADALLIINGNGEIERYARDYAISYALVLPVFFVKGNTANTLFKTSATMWDVRNEYLYLTTESEGKYNANYPIAFPESNREAFLKSKDKALDQLQKNLIAMVNGQ